MNAETGTHLDVPHTIIYLLKNTRPNLHFLMGVHVKHVTANKCVLTLTCFSRKAV